MNSSFRFFVSGILASALSIHAEDSSHDLVIYGATPGGLIASIAAARQGASVVVIEPTPWIGGMTTGGLTRSDVGKEQTIGGLTREYFERAAARYHGENLWYAEPHANMETFQTMIEEAGVETRTSRTIQSVKKDGRKLLSLTTDSGEVFHGRQFIDASYEGDLMALAGVSYIVGRESRTQYNEPLAGYYPMSVRERSAETMAYDGYLRGEKGGPRYVHGTPTQIRSRDDHGHLLFGVHPAPDLQPGDADHATQSYNFRVVVTQREDIRIPFPKPENYNPSHFELLLRLIQSYPVVRFGRLVHLGEVANGKYDLNAQGFFSTDFPGANFDYPDGDTATRERIYQEHKDYVQGFLWFLGHDERVPKQLRDETNSWGLCRDEFTDNDHWPYALYVREGRRMIGEYVMTQQDCQRRIRKPDSIGMGSFLLDCHIVQRIETPEGFVVDEGSFQDTPTRPYQIPYRSITPKADECENLLVPVCLSASHIACCSIRMEPVYMALSHAAGLAAVEAMRSNQPVQEINVPGLQTALRKQQAVLELDDGATGPESVDLPGIVVDDMDAEFVGPWTGSNYGTPVDGFGHHDGDSDKGKKTATFTARIPTSGRYEVRFAYSSAPNRCQATPVTVIHSEGASALTVDETKPPEFDKAFTSLGVFAFSQDLPAIVRITNEATQGYVSVDAVQFLPITE